MEASSQLTGVSCPTTRFCAATGTSSQNEYGSTMSTLVELFGGKSWSIQPSPTVGTWSGLFGISCPSRTFCAAVGYVSVGQTTSAADYPREQPLIETYQHSKWSAVRSPTILGGGSLGSVSCASTRFRVAVGSRGSSTLVEVFDGKSWSVVPSPNGPTTFGSLLSGVSCTSAVSCHAVGSYYASKTAGQRPLTESYTGGGWTLASLPTAPDGGQLNGISCTRSTSCTAVGVGFKAPDGTNLAYTVNGNMWMSAPGASRFRGSQPGLAAVSCSSAHSCVAVGSHYGGNSSYVTTSEVFSGGLWSPLTSRNVATKAVGDPAQF